VKATTRTSAPGSDARGRAAAGFTLLELMVVMLLVAVATGMVTLSMRDASQNKLDEEGARLSAVLESARAQSRIVGTEVRWQPSQDGASFEFVGLPAVTAAELPTRWLDADTRAEVVGAPQVQLGPEPMLPAQRIVLRLGGHELTVGTDGLSPFEVIVPGAEGGDKVASR
jgi:general secretion pathway protein H